MVVPLDRRRGTTARRYCCLGTLDDGCSAFISPPAEQRYRSDAFARQRRRARGIGIARSYGRLPNEYGKAGARTAAASPPKDLRIIARLEARRSRRRGLSPSVLPPYPRRRPVEISLPASARFRATARLVKAQPLENRDRTAVYPLRWKRSQGVLKKEH